MPICLLSSRPRLSDRRALRGAKPLRPGDQQTCVDSAQNEHFTLARFVLSTASAMFPILEARYVAPDVKLFRIEAPRIARKRLAGQFVILRVHEHGERIPITIADSDAVRGDITIVVQGIGKTTRLLNSLEAGDRIMDVVGPLGRPSEVEKFGTACVIGGGVGAAIAYPTAVALKRAGNRVVSILGGRTRALVILEDELRAASDVLYVTTDDGSYGEKGLVTDKLRALIEGGEKIDYVLAIGPIPMMRAVAETTRPHAIRTVVSLNSIMVDGTGMCGGCRVSVGGESRFACVDGPEFDAHQVDFQNLASRNAMYREAEARALADFLAHPQKDLALVHDCRLLAQAEEVKA
jgi:ferredoxin--NADP+ reductase